MSAFQVSDDHIRVLAIALEYGTGERNQRDLLPDFGAVESLAPGERPESWNPVGRVRRVQEWCAKLYRANLASVATRYREPLPTDEDTGPRVTFRDASRLEPKLRDAVLVIKAAHCFDYQACEVDAWEKSDIAAALRRLVWEAAHHVPGWSDAPWGLQ